MGIGSTIWDTVGQLVVWGKALANEASGKGQVETSGDDDREDVEHCALPGFYSVISSSDKLLILRRDDGGVSVAAKTERPSGAATGDRGIVTADTHVLVRGAMCSVLKTTASAPLAVVRDTDHAHNTAAMTLWMSQVAAAINAIAPGAISPAAVDPIATCEATSTRLEAD